MNTVLPDFLDEHPTTVARKLLGCFMVRTFDDGSTATVRIVETESYDQTDPASHTYKGMTTRSATMFGPSGHWYVYFTYGMHYCCNMVSAAEGFGAGVLIRAVEPVEGEELLQERRNRTGIDVTNGPAKLCQALGIDLKMNGHDARMAPLQLLAGDPVQDNNVTVAKRIGISQAKDELRRFYVTDSPYVSVRVRS